MDATSLPQDLHSQPAPSNKHHGYVPLHPEVYHFKPEYLNPILRSALESTTSTPSDSSSTQVLSAVEMVVPGVFTFPCLNEEYCRMLVEELEHLERSGVRMVRPNSMNRYGAILDKCGFKECMNQLVASVMVPLASVLFPDVVSSQDGQVSSSGVSLDKSNAKDAKDKVAATDVDQVTHPQGVEVSIDPRTTDTKPNEPKDSKLPTAVAGPLKYHHAFTVRYAVGEDRKLDRHRDDCDITLNVCLGKTFEGGRVVFQGLEGSSVYRLPQSVHRYEREEREHAVDHRVGTALFHLGRHVHRAEKLTSGERINLIVWTRNKPFDPSYEGM